MSYHYFGNSTIDDMKAMCTRYVHKICIKIFKQLTLQRKQLYSNMKSTSSKNVL